MTGQRIRLNVARVLDRASLGEFSLAPSQGPVLALYVPIERLQRDLDLGDRANALLVKGVGDLFDPRNSLANSCNQLSRWTTLGCELGQVPDDATVVESRAGLITDSLAEQIAEIANEWPRTPGPDLRRQFDQNWRS